MLAESLRSFERALPSYAPAEDIWTILLERALTASRRLGYLPARHPTDGLDGNPASATAVTAARRPKAPSRGTRSPAPPLRRKTRKVRR